MKVNKRKILLVEDEAVLREALREWLTDDGYDVEVAESGEEAVERIKEEEFGVIVLDLRLPGIDGLRAFEEEIAFFWVLDTKAGEIYLGSVSFNLSEIGKSGQIKHQCGSKRILGIHAIMKR